MTGKKGVEELWSLASTAAAIPPAASRAPPATNGHIGKPSAATGTGANGALWVGRSAAVKLKSLGAPMKGSEMAYADACVTAISPAVMVASSLGRSSSVHGQDRFFPTVPTARSSSPPLQDPRKSSTDASPLRIQTVAIPSSLITWVWVGVALILKLVPRTPMAAVGVQIVYALLLASPVVNRSVPFNILRATVPC